MNRTHLLVAAAALSACATQRPAIRAAVKIGQPVGLVAPDLEGRSVDVAADQGKVRVVDFWATWCVPCRDELPALGQLVRQWGSRGLSVYAVSFDEDPDQIRAFLKEVPVAFPVLWDKEGELHESSFEVNRLPTTFLIDRKGVIRYVHEGYDNGIAAAQRREIQSLLAEQ
jgi:cytochrome c biogenesis protein CcmG/thiol:disulfide interchange protein DsbE